ncbi:hypothetical protein ACSZML_15185 [Aeromonas rivipollensis]
MSQLMGNRAPRLETDNDPLFIHEAQQEFAAAPWLTSRQTPFASTRGRFPATDFLYVAAIGSRASHFPIESGLNEAGIKGFL